MADVPLILVVEDSQTQAQELSARLMEGGFEVVLAGDGPQALRIADVYQPDLIVLDVNLPTMSGYQICDRLRRDPSTANIPIVMLTAADSSEDIQTGYRAGADAYIPKGTFAINHLFATFERIGFPAANSTGV